MPAADPRRIVILAFPYVEALRVERARQLLEEGDDPVELIADRCGFGTPERGVT